MVRVCISIWYVLKHMLGYSTSIIFNVISSLKVHNVLDIIKPIMLKHSSWYTISTQFILYVNMHVLQELQPRALKHQHRGLERFHSGRAFALQTTYSRWTRVQSPASYFWVQSQGWTNKKSRTVKEGDKRHVL